MLDIERFLKLLSNNKYQNESLLSEREFNLTSSSVNNLLLKLSTGKVTSVELTSAFIKKYMIINDIFEIDPIMRNKLTNALASARFLDGYYKTTQTLIGPLHGLPINEEQLKRLQENFGIENDDLQSMGYVKLYMANHMNLMGENDIFSDKSSSYVNTSNTSNPLPRKLSTSSSSSSLSSLLLTSAAPTPSLTPRGSVYDGLTLVKY
ncbi:uncharacterized protein KGF55_005117 [Candida pseudojiufengensis]|uniref:uncharacterized protein n=1 Tax=Candida pseudojiufengensis TaxID=497109 RepID=UPI0022242679|nr:uncharacterized protein KGF55_005117 [Candida pseudojiufengensis]KAI5959885.1 hypothetical protein KGF55_005117 [Candida pseudojiufengensis]